MKPFRDNNRIKARKKLKCKLLAGVVLPVLFVCITASCGRMQPETKSGLVMDTVFTVTVYGDAEITDRLLEAADQLDKTVLSRFEAGSLVSRYTQDISADGSEQISTGNDLQADTDAGNSESSYDAEAESRYIASVYGREYDLDDIFSDCEDIRYDSAGAFDVRIGALSDLWDIKGRMTGEDKDGFPVPAQIESLRGDRSVPDLGSVGKGIYLDLAYDILSDSNASAAVVSAGGSILVYGQKPDGKLFRVAIRDPFPGSSSDAFATIILSGTHFVSTSGSYERFIEYNGEIYHHIIDPLSGYPAWTRDDILNRSQISASSLSSPIPVPEHIPVSVTIISDSGFYSDALSTACFVLGPDMGIALAEKYSSEAIFIMDDGTVLASHGIIFDERSNTFELAY